jgi:hypothetical protein
MFLFFESGRFLVKWRRNFNNIRIHEKQSELFARGVVITNKEHINKKKKRKQRDKERNNVDRKFLLFKEEKEIFCLSSIRGLR